MTQAEARPLTVPILTRFACCSPQLDPLPREWADGDGMTSRAWCARRRGNCVSMLVSQLYRLTDLLTRPTETGETARDADDSRQADHQGSARRTGMPETRKTHVVRLITQRSRGSNPAPATRQDGSPEVIWRAVFVANVTNFVTSGCLSPPHRSPVPRL